MALPDSDKVIQELNRRFAAPLPEFYARRIIFWYDVNPGSKTGAVSHPTMQTD